MRRWRWICWLSLVVIVSAAPARQVEAAGDLARTMAERDEDHRVEEIDGGVGDDSLEATRADAPAASWAEVPLEPLGFNAPSGGISIPGPGRSRLVAPIVWQIPTRSSRRQAWLGCFLF